MLTSGTVDSRRHSVPTLSPSRSSPHRLLVAKEATTTRTALLVSISNCNHFAVWPNGVAVLNDTVYPDNYNYFKPSLPVVVNGRSDPTSQRSHDICTPFNVTMPKTPPFALKNVALGQFNGLACLRSIIDAFYTVSNGNCASTCAQFSTLMYEHYKVKIATFGGKPGEPMEYKGMAGNQVLEFADLKSEIKTARLNNSTLAPPDLLVNGNMRYVTSKPMFTMPLM
jgi:hypothetical protein